MPAKQLTKKPFELYVEEFLKYHREFPDTPCLLVVPDNQSIEDFIKIPSEFVKTMSLNPKNPDVQQLHRALWGSETFEGGTLKVIKLEILRKYKRHPDVEFFVEDILSLVTVEMLSKGGFNAIVSYDRARRQFFPYLIDRIKWKAKGIADKFFEKRERDPHFCEDNSYADIEPVTVSRSHNSVRSSSYVDEPSELIRMKPTKVPFDPVEYILWVKYIVEKIELNIGKELSTTTKFRKMKGPDFKELTGYASGNCIIHQIQRILKEDRFCLDGTSATYESVINFIGLNKVSRRAAYPSWTAKNLIPLIIKQVKAEGLDKLSKRDKKYLQVYAKSQKKKTHELLRVKGAISCSSSFRGRSNTTYIKDLRTLIEAQQEPIETFDDLKQHPDLYRNYCTLINRLRINRDSKPISRQEKKKCVILPVNYFETRFLLGLKTKYLKKAHHMRFVRTIIQKAKNKEDAFNEASKYFVGIQMTDIEKLCIISSL
jgi:hypothetical protein